MTGVTIPGVTRELVEYLEAQFPPRCKRIGEDNDSHMEYAGFVKLTQWLRLSLDEQRDADPAEAIIQELTR